MERTGRLRRPSCGLPNSAATPEPLANGYAGVAIEPCSDDAAVVVDAHSLVDALARAKQLLESY
jgi:hypothetical protein